MAVTAYVVGQWVREDRFYGRRDVLEEALDGNRGCLWLLGTRRVGKTSILKQLEYLAVSAPEPRYFPIFWDFQGSEEVEDLHESFRDSLLDAIGRLDRLGIGLEAVEDDDLFVSMARLRRELQARTLTLLVLGDEVEELVEIYAKAPRFLRQLRRALQSPENIRTVFASTIRLWQLAQEGASTSPFLHGFTPPLVVRGLDDSAARALVRQAQLPVQLQPQLDDRTVEEICSRCDNHPYLLQVLSERLLELGDLEAAIEEIASDQMVSFFFAADLTMLAPIERQMLRLIQQQPGTTSESLQAQLTLTVGSFRGSMQRLVNLGFVAQAEDGGLVLPNYFFARWFAEQPAEQLAGEGDDPDATVGSSTVRTKRGEVTGAGQGRTVDGRYELLECLGHGGTGEVYKAHDTLLRSIVAVKMLRREYCADQEAIERLRREVILARDLSHPNILKIYHLGDDQGQRYITMKYVDGPDLAQVLSTEAPLPLTRSVALAAKLAAALTALHRCKVLHRDVKPSNVLIDRLGEPHLMDFGLARLQWGPGITQNGTFLGTPAYASPEQALGEHLDERSDLYSLGLVLFELVTGRLPFVGQSTAEILGQRLQQQPPPPKELVPGLPAVISELILRCLARHPSDRIQSAAELQRELLALS